jgi:hypothetical protein
MDMNRDAMPKILLLTDSAADSRYASAEVIRGILRHIPRDRVRWACLRSIREQSEFHDCQAKHFPPRLLHWRLNAGWWQYLYTRAQARRIAGAVCAWVRDFGPDLVWVFPGTDSVIVARHLEQMLRIPVHMTVHDAFEINRVFWPHAYLYGIYQRDVASLLKKVVTMDAVSRELIEHVKSQFETKLTGTLEFPPSTDLASPIPSEKNPPWNNNVHRIGLCGNPRVERRQWDAFVGMLSGLPHTFEIHAFGNVEAMVDTRYPPNVRLIPLGFAENESEIVAYLHDHGMSVCYLGLYRDADRAFFARTSLSSKLTTYAAAGCPVCIDGPEDSVAWRLILKYDAGVIVNASLGGSEDLVELLNDGEVWRRKNEGACRLCATEMDLARNTGRLLDLMVLAKQTRI